MVWNGAMGSQKVGRFLGLLGVVLGGLRRFWEAGPSFFEAF